MQTAFELPLVRHNRIVFVKVARLILFIIFVCGLLLVTGGRGREPFLITVDASIEFWLLTILGLFVIFAGILFFAIMRTSWFKDGTIRFESDQIYIQRSNEEIQLKLSNVENITFKDDVQLSESRERDVADHYGVLTVKTVGREKKLKHHYIVPNKETHEMSREFIKYLKSKGIDVRVQYR